MNHFLYILLLSSILFTQDRSTLFSTGNPPDLGGGWDIRCNEFSSNGTGDINDDDNVDVFDIVRIVSFILGTNAPTDEEFNASDTNFDSSIDVLDILIIVNLIMMIQPKMNFIRKNQYHMENNQ